MKRSRAHYPFITDDLASISVVPIVIPWPEATSREPLTLSTYTHVRVSLDGDA